MSRKIGRHVWVLAALMLAPDVAFAQAPVTTRTPDGHPDLQGVWATAFITRLERSKEASTLEVSPEDARRIADAIGERARQSKVDDPDFAHYGYDQLATVRGIFRSSLITEPTDGKIPYSPAGIDVAEKFDRLESYGFDHPEERPPYERCMAGILAAPMRTLALFIPIQIVQTPNYIVMTNEDAGGPRIIPIGEPAPPALPRFEGRARARWDGDTLVVETAAIMPQAYIAISEAVGIPNNGDMHIVERIRLAEPNVMHDELTVTAPNVLTEPWKTTRIFRRYPDRNYEITEGQCEQENLVPGKDEHGNDIFVSNPQGPYGTVPAAK